MAQTFIDLNGLAHAFSKVKALVAGKANADLSNVDKETLAAAVDPATSSTAGLMSAADKAKLDGIATGANKYTHPTTSGNKHIPSGGSSGQILKWSADGTATWGAAPSVTVDSALSSTSTNPVQNKVVNSALGGKLPTGGVDTDFSEYTTWAALLSALPVGSVTMVRIAEINDALVPADCPDTSWASFVIRKPNTVYQTCSATLHAYTENGPRIFEATFAQGTAEVTWIEVANAADVGGAESHIATIGTSGWAEDSETGVKTKTVSVSGVTADHNAKVSNYFNGSKTADGYAAFVEQENQFLDYITNGFAETVAGGIKFTIFGDAPTVSIPILVEVV